MLQKRMVAFLEWWLYKAKDGPIQVSGDRRNPRDVAFNFLAGRSTVSSIVSKVSEALWLVLQPLYLQHPSTTDEWMKISQEFHERWNIPHCLGSFSKSLLAVCDAQYRFIYVEVGHSGSESDGGICSRCNLQKIILQGALGLPPVSTVGNEGPLPYFFVGDEAFPLKEHVMRPHARRTLHEDDDKSYERRVFNYRMSRARRTIENTFGILAQRWRESTASSTAYCPPGATDSEDWEEHLSPGSWRDEAAGGGALIPSRPTGCNAARYAKEVRDKLAHYFVTDGQVPWQDKVVNRT
ncbi:hypothetical protein MRX96_049420 [Rhipicephalus microplus]